MNKELTPLKAHKELLQRYGRNFSQQDDVRAKIIETTLKDYEQRLKLAKEHKDVNNVAKRLVALEIIKEIVPIEENAFEYDIESDAYYFLDISIAKDKYDLLKEVLL